MILFALEGDSPTEKEKKMGGGMRNEFGRKTDFIEVRKCEKSKGVLFFSITLVLEKK